MQVKIRKSCTKPKNDEVWFTAAIEAVKGVLNIQEILLEKNVPGQKKMKSNKEQIYKSIKLYWFKKEQL